MNYLSESLKMLMDRSKEQMSVPNGQHDNSLDEGEKHTTIS